MLIPPYTIHRQIYLIRKFSGLNQVEMSKRLNITQGWLSKLESGMGEVTVSQLIALRDTFGISADALVDGQVNYLDLATRFNTEVKLPEKFSDGANIRLRTLYGPVALFENRLGARATARMLRSIGLKPHLLAEPRLMVNSRLLMEVIRECKERSLFSRRSALREVAKVYISPAALGSEYGSLTQSRTPKEAYSRFGTLMSDLFFGQECEFVVRKSGKQSAEVEFKPSDRLATTLRVDPEINRIFCQYGHELVRELAEISPAKSVSVTQIGARRTGSDPVDEGLFQVKWA